MSQLALTIFSCHLRYCPKSPVFQAKTNVLEHHVKLSGNLYGHVLILRILKLCGLAKRVSLMVQTGWPCCCRRQDSWVRKRWWWGKGIPSSGFSCTCGNWKRKHIEHGGLQLRDIQLIILICSQYFLIPPSTLAAVVG